MSRARNFPLLDSRMVSMGVLSDDFPTVDLREGYANLSLPKEAKFKSSGDGSAPPRLSVWFSALFLLPFRGVCLAAARVSAAHLS